jgi:hypothetical protein
VRSLERSGVPRSTAMAMVGHKTEAIYRRYAIVDAAMLQEGGQKLDAFTLEQKAKAKAEAERRRGQVVAFSANGQKSFVSQRSVNFCSRSSLGSFLNMAKA